MARKVKILPPSKLPKVSNGLNNWVLWVVGGIILIISFANLTVWGWNVVAQWRREPIEKEIAQWEQIVQETPTYRDGYLKLATLYWKLHEDGKAKAALDEAQKIDPNYEETKKLRGLLGY